MQQSRPFTKVYPQDKSYLKLSKKEQDTKSRLRNLIRFSNYNRSKDTVTVFFKDLFNRGLYSYLNYDKSEQDIKEWEFLQSVPAFQRSNDKWSEQMQVSFVNNVMLGLNTTIILSEVIGDGEKMVGNYLILDGLQRLTALYRFYLGEIKWQGYTFQQLCDMKVITFASHHVTFHLYNFKTEIEQVRFYIDMNENITHSENDIKRAYEYLESLEVMTKTQQAREKFKNLGLDYSLITKDDIFKLIDFLKIELKQSAKDGNLEMQIKELRISYLNPSQKMGLKHAFISVESAYFDRRQGISFEENGFIGFCGWADGANHKPFLTAFDKWINWKLEQIK